MGRLLLVRHGQASWGAEDYDVLSQVGHDQSIALGRALATRDVVPDRVVTGAMKRHRETWEQIAVGGGFDVPATEDAGWDEFDHEAMLARVPVPFEGRDPTRAEFQAWFEAATDRWTCGEYDDYPESFTDFGARVADALRRTPGDGTTLVVTSGGPISWALASLISDSPVEVWRRTNPVCVNSGVTTIVNGRRGMTLVSFNEHTHLTPALLSYR